MSSQPTHNQDSHPELPIDPDIVRTRNVKQPIHVSITFQAVVFAGGCLGALTRYSVSLLLPERTGSWPLSTFIVNMVGAFTLGYLLESLAKPGKDTGKRRLIRLGVGTGFIGAFTTYSALAVETDLLAHNGDLALATKYILLSVCVGAILSALGIQCASKHHTYKGRTV